jgi:hypothetical protein
MASMADNGIDLSPSRLRLSAGAFERIVSALILAGVVGAVIYGWRHRTDSWINPEHGFGYTLGIVGGSMMLLLLAYPLRKRTRRPMRAAGSVGFWFRFHMLLGLLGPLAVLYHARFSWGALNSAMALGSMIVVATSGLVGRFFYSRVHRGFSGRKLEVRALKVEMDQLLREIEHRGVARGEIVDVLHRFEDRAVAAGRAFWPSALAVLSLSVETRLAERKLRGSQLQIRAADAASVDSLFEDFFQAVRRAAEFAFYDRLLRLWHLFHLPLFFILVAAAVLHIVAVHMY